MTLGGPHRHKVLNRWIPLSQLQVRGSTLLKVLTIFSSPLGKQCDLPCTCTDYIIDNGFGMKVVMNLL